MREQRLPEAETYLRKAIEFDPDYADAYANLGRVLMQHRDEKVRQEGRTYIEKAFKLDPAIAQEEELKKILKNEGK
jgi:cytochrome c-type biogenesis protein CcmH/NrfG